MNWFLTILIGVVGCVPTSINEDCICKIETNKQMYYCGYELRDRNCYPQAEYKCPNGDNGKARFLKQCHSSPCAFFQDVASCGSFKEFEAGVKNGSNTKCEGCWFLSELGGERFGVKSFYTNLNEGTVLYTEAENNMWQKMPFRHPTTLSNTLPRPRERVKPLNH